LIFGAGEEFLDLGAQALLLMQTSLVLGVDVNESLSMQVSLSEVFAFSELQVLLEEGSILLGEDG